MDLTSFEIAEDVTFGTRIKVIGVGGCGGNAVDRMLAEGIPGVEFHVLNTDRQALLASRAPNKLAIGAKITGGLGAGCNPEIGRQSALEDTERIIEILEGSDMVFVAAGLGGGTGTGAAPVIASLAKELNALTVAIVTKPFEFERNSRARAAEQGLAELAGTVDAVITIPNQRLLEIAPEEAGLEEAFDLANDVLVNAVRGISDIITTPGKVNRDFSDIRAIMSGMGHAMMSTAVADGPNAVTEAARRAIECPLLDDGGIRGARGVLVNITASKDLRIRDVDKACRLIGEATGNEDLQIHFGVIRDDSMNGSAKVTVIATGFPRAAATLTPPSVSSWRPDPPKVSAAAAAATAPAPAIMKTIIEPQPVREVNSAPPPEPITEDDLPRFESAPAMPEPPRADAADDLDTPAFIRRGHDRRFYQ